jgi:hypothetical protein
MKKQQPKPLIREHQIEVTYEYDVFERMPGNRPVDSAWVAFLKKKMLKKDLKVPIQVNQNFEVVDGQHRLQARREAGLPVYYYVSQDYGLEEVQELNASQKKWSIEDHVDSFIELGKADYTTYRWFKNQYGFPHQVCVRLLANVGDGRSVRELFFSGGFRATNLQNAKLVAEKLLQIEPYFPEHWNNKSFLEAMLFVMRKKAFDFKKFIKKLETFPTSLKPQAGKDMYVAHIEDVYNYKAVNKVSLRFGEDID